MRILVGKCFGIGNAVMAVPMIKALQWKPDTIVDVLVGDTPDDVGAIQVLSKVVQCPGKIYVNTARESVYDVAVMAIPFDGRWRNGVHFIAKTVMDGRTRPDPKTTGLISWKDHESEYQMENARALGYLESTPSCAFLPVVPANGKMIYIGMGYKKDQLGFWKSKHWGNENYAELITGLLKNLPQDWKIVTTGDVGDLQLSIAPVARMVNDKRFEFKLSANLDEAFQVVASCGLYVGNDTGMMHVAASCGRNVIAMFFLENSIVKSRPLLSSRSDFTTQDCLVLDGTVDRAKITPQYVQTAVEVMLCG